MIDCDGDYFKRNAEFERKLDLTVASSINKKNIVCVEVRTTLYMHGGGQKYRTQQQIT
jgi:hypothetical protein